LVTYVFHLKGCYFNHVNVIVESVHSYVETFDKESTRLVQESSQLNSTTAFNSRRGILMVFTGATFVFAQIKLT